MKHKKINKIPTYAFGIDQAAGIGNILGTFMQGFGGYNGAGPGMESTQSGLGVAGGAITGAASGAAAGLSIGGPIGAAAGGLLGGVTSLIGANKRNKAIQRRNNQRRTLQQTEAGLNRQADLQAEWYDENYDAYTFANGGIMPNMDLAYVDDNEILRDVNGQLSQVPDGANGTDQNLINAGQLESVLSDKLKVPGTTKTFAETMEKYIKQPKSAREFSDKYSKGREEAEAMSAQIMYDNLLAQQEALKIKKGIKPSMKGVPAYKNGVLNWGNLISQNLLNPNNVLPEVEVTAPMYGSSTAYVNAAEASPFGKGLRALGRGLYDATVGATKAGNAAVSKPTKTQVTSTPYQQNPTSVSTGAWPIPYVGTPAQSKPANYVVDAYTQASNGYHGLPEIINTPTTPATNYTPMSTTTTSVATPSVKPTTVPPSIVRDPNMARLASPTLAGVSRNYMGVNQSNPYQQVLGDTISRINPANPVEGNVLNADNESPQNSNGGFNMGSLLALAPTMYNWIQGMQNPETEVPIMNPYSGSIQRQMARRRMNVNPLIEAARTSRSLANYNASNMNTSTGSNLAMRTQMAADEARNVANIYANKQNTDNQYLAEYANMLNSLGQQYSTSKQYTNDINARNRAAARNYTASAASQLGEWSQIQQQMRNQKGRDQMTYPMLRNYLSTALPKDQLEAMDRQYYQMNPYYKALWQ